MSSFGITENPRNIEGYYEVRLHELPPISIQLEGIANG